MRTVILLGMAACTRDYLQTERRGPYTRDRARYDQLQQLLSKYKVITSNYQTIADDISADSLIHIDAKWSTRGARAFTKSYIDLFNKSSNSTFVPTIDYIIMDYFRMPPNYITLSIFEFFITLYEKLFIHHEAIIILPHQQGLIQYIKEQTLSNRSIQFRYQLIDKTQNPLYTATSKVDQAKLGKNTNEGEIQKIQKQLPTTKCNKLPFIALTISKR